MLRRRIVSSILMMLFSFVFTKMTYAAAFQFYELGTPIIGLAAVGQAALSDDASTAYFNPAGMTQLCSSQFLVGGELLLPYTNFMASPRNTFSGDNGGNAGTLTPGMSVYYVYDVNPRTRLGVSLTSPYGGSLTYDNGWVGRYIVQDMLFYTVNLNPSIAYQVNHWLSIGLGASVEYANLHETVALPTLDPTVDGQVTVKTDNTAFGANAGLLFTPSSTTKFGVAYRSQIKHDLRGRDVFFRIVEEPHTSLSMIMPQNIILSAIHKMNNCFTLLGEAGWANWASMHNTVLHVDGFSLTIPRDWRNTYRFGVATRYQLLPCLLYQLGVSYDTSPTESSHRTPDLPMDRQIRIGTGFVYSAVKAIKIGLNYEYMNFGNANINAVTPIGTLSGSYARNYINVFQASINVDC